MMKKYIHKIIKVFAYDYRYLCEKCPYNSGGVCKYPDDMPGDCLYDDDD